MKMHIITVGTPKLSYAKLGWEDYTKRLSHYHQLRITHLPDKQNDARSMERAIGSSSYVVTLEITGQQLSSPALADFIDKRALAGQQLCFIIGGPDGLPSEISKRADYRWSFSALTYPHDLAMVLLAESLYRAATISAGQPYHR
jgi:23S rRNA (pseudouridine1915-N3)-methyltransferase